jgi:hypothetical protein
MKTHPGAMFLFYFYNELDFYITNFNLLKNVGHIHFFIGKIDLFINAPAKSANFSEPLIL